MHDKMLISSPFKILINFEPAFLQANAAPPSPSSWAHVHRLKVDYPHLQIYGFVTDPLATAVAAQPNE